MARPKFAPKKNFLGYTDMEMDMLYTMAKHPRVQKYDFKRKYHVGTDKMDRAYKKLKADGMFVYGTHHVTRGFYENFIVTFIGISLDDASLAEAVCSQLCLLPEVLEVYPVYGRYDVLAKVVAGTPKGLYATISEKIRRVEGVVSTEAMLCGPDANFNDLRGPWHGGVAYDDGRIGPDAAPGSEVPPASESGDPDVAEAMELEYLPGDEELAPEGGDEEPGGGDEEPRAD